jgi:hypothetical protein
LRTRRAFSFSQLIILFRGTNVVSSNGEARWPDLNADAAPVVREAACLNLAFLLVLFFGEAKKMYESNVLPLQLDAFIEAWQNQMHLTQRTPRS